MSRCTTSLNLALTFQLDIHISFYAEVRSQPGNSFTNWILTCQFLGVSLGTVFSGWLIAKFRRCKWLLVGSTVSAFVLYLLMALGIVRECHFLWVGGKHVTKVSTEPENAKFAPVLIANGVALGAIQNCLIVSLFSSTSEKGMSLALLFASHNSNPSSKREANN